MKPHFIFQVKSFEHAKKELNEARRKNPDKLLGFTSSDAELNRKVLEKLSFDIFMPILTFRKDFQKN